MGRAVRVAKGICALVALAALIGGIPWALWHFVGWPLPHHVPSAAQVGRALDHRGIPAQVLVDALAVVVWLAWASLVASVAAEVPAALAGRRARRLPVAGAFQPVAGRLVAAVVVAALTLAPRAAPHDGGGPLASRLPPRPAVALVLADATAPVAPTIPSAPAPGGVLAPGPVASASSPAPTTYVVQRGDTLWGIAERELGDLLRWSEIFQMNEGRPQPGGATLTDPHWIDPGWTLLLPAASPSQPAPPQPAPAPPAAPKAPTGTAPGTGASPTTPTHNGKAPAHASRPEHGQADSGAPVRLPSGSLVAGSFAAGVLSAVAFGRLRRRHAYRYRPPEPGLDLTPAPRRPTLAHLARPGDDAEEELDGAESAGSDGFPFTAPDRRLDPGRVEVARRGAETITAEVTDLSGIAVCGPAADDVVRALLTSLVVGAGPGGAEVLFTASVADRLFPGAETNRALRRATTAEDLARKVEVEQIARARRLEAVGAPDAGTFRHDNPEHPLPALLVVAEPPPPERMGRWEVLAAEVARLGAAVAYLGDTVAATARLVTDADRLVTDASPAAFGERFVGAELFGLRADEAVELLDVIAEGFADEPDPEEPDPDDLDHDHADGHQPEAPRAGQPWPEPHPHAEHEERPIRVQLLGPMAVSVAGEVVAVGLRDRAKVLFAWFLLRPEGARSEEAVDVLWPDTLPDQVGRQFGRAFGDLRTRLHDAGGEDLVVLIKIGEHYRPVAEEIACDLWDFEAALADAARHEGEEAAMALRRATDVYQGDLLHGARWQWVEPIRQDLRRRAVDAHLRLAELEEQGAHLPAALQALERAVDLDRYSEEPYRRLMSLQARCGRPDAIKSTWLLLRRRLAELELDVEGSTARLYRTLSTTSAGATERTGPPRTDS